MSIGGVDVGRQWLGTSPNPFLPPSARGGIEPALVADTDFGELDEPTRDFLLDDLDSYMPRPIPAYSETAGASSGPGLAVSYDVLTGVETIHAAAVGPFPESGEVPGSFSEFSAIWAEMNESNSDDDEMADSFNALSLVENPDLFPWRVNVKLFINFNGANYVASGVLIDPMHVLTAGHCVYDSDEGGWATSITVVPGYEDGAKPYGEAKSVQLHSWTGWTGSRDYDHDIGVIDLDRPIGALTSWYGYGYNSNSFFYTGNTFHNSGYPAASPYNGRFMYYQYGSFDYFIPLTNRVGIWREAFGGQSGSGAYHMSGDSRTVYCVLSNGSSSATNFIRLTESKFKDIRDTYIAEDTPSTFDLIPLNVKVSPETINSGSAPTSMTYVVHNYSSVAWSGTVNVDVYLSTNDNITTSDTLLQSHSFTRSFSAKGTTTITVGAPPTIPASTASGNYWIGVIITTPDHNTGNNDTDGWDAAKVYVNHVDQPPVISPLPDVSLDEDTSLANAIDLWAYVSDSETVDSGLTYSIVGNTNPNCGVTINSQRYVSVNPAANWNGHSDVTIRVTDPGGLYAQDMFRVTVNPVNDSPTLAALPDISLDEDTSLVGAINLWAYASDLETAASGLTYTIVANTEPDCGVSIASNRYVNVSPTADWNGFSDVTIRVTDPGGLFAQRTFRITVHPVNDPPVAVDDHYSCEMGDTLIRTARMGVLVNDHDVDDTEFFAVLSSGPSHGTLVSLGSNGWFEYRASDAFFGVDSFTYRAFDGEAYSQPATVWIEVLSRLPGDADRNGTVDQADSVFLASNWGKASGMSWEHGDFNGDGRVDALDAAILAANWGQTIPGESVVALVPSAFVPSESEIVVGPLESEERGTTRPLLRPAVDRAFLADDSRTRVIEPDIDDPDIDDGVFDLLASGNSSPRASDGSMVAQEASDAALAEYLDSLDTTPVAVPRGGGRLASG